MTNFEQKYRDFTDKIANMKNPPHPTYFRELRKEAKNIIDEELSEAGL